MINVFILQGVVRDIQKKSLNGQKVLLFKLKVKRKNDETIRDTFEILLFDNLAEMFDALIDNGDKISVQGHIETDEFNNYKFIADKVTYNN